MTNEDRWTREEHLAWAKKRALEYVEIGDIQQAFSSMASDLDKHSETKGHPGIMMGFGEMLLPGGMTADRMTKWIEGFN